MRPTCERWNCCGDPKTTGEMHKDAEDIKLTTTTKKRIK